MVTFFLHLSLHYFNANIHSTWLGAPSLSSGNSVRVPKYGNKGAKDFNGKIIGIRDIEETLWEPKLGIKGMVDVSVEIKDMHGNKKVCSIYLPTCVFRFNPKLMCNYSGQEFILS